MHYVTSVSYLRLDSSKTSLDLCKMLQLIFRNKRIMLLELFYIQLRELFPQWEKKFHRNKIIAKWRDLEQ